jgi:hypothetical protein
VLPKFLLGACTGFVLLRASTFAWADDSFNTIGSIAYDKVSGGYGASHGYLYEQDAKESARRACQSKGNLYCKVIITFDTCGAVSAGSNGVYWGVGLNRDLAVSRSMNACTKDSKSCNSVIWICNSTLTHQGPGSTPFKSNPSPNPNPNDIPLPCPYGTHPGLGGCYGY